MHLSMHTILTDSEIVRLFEMLAIIKMFASLINKLFSCKLSQFSWLLFGCGSMLALF